MRTLFYIIFTAIVMSTGCLGVSCSSDGDGWSSGDAVSLNDSEDMDAAMDFIDRYMSDTLLVNRWSGFLKHDLGEANEWDSYLAMPDKGSEKLTLHYPGGTLRELFRDSNRWHYAVGDTLGIRPIVETDHATYPLPGSLVPVRSTEHYRIDHLTYSYPYLVPEALSLLNEVGRRFHQALEERGGGPYRIKVTSLLRTRQSIDSLQNVNTASVYASSHLRGVSFDLSTSNFPFMGGTPHRTQEDLKNLLAEILHGLRAEGRCYVIFEPKQSCFHVTVRP